MRKKILKKKYKNLCKLLLGGATFFGSMFIGADTASALPVEPAAINRENIQAIVNADGGVMNITGTGNAFISWKDFSINPNEIVNFSGMTNMLNYVSGVNPSLIYGTINAPTVKDFYVINPSGVLFGPNSQVITNNFYVSTRSLTENDINKYVSNGTNPLDSSIDVSRINDGGLKSSDIMGAYDIADGDVMFLGKVQANSLKVEGNTIQIRNTQNITDADGNVLTGNKVNLISNNPVEVGYQITEDDFDENNLTNPFMFFNDEYKNLSDEEFITKLAEFYNIYQYKKNIDNHLSVPDDNESTPKYYSDSSRENLGYFYDFYIEKVNALDGVSEKEKLIAAFSMDMLLRSGLTYDNYADLIFTDEDGNAHQITSKVTGYTYDGNYNYETILEKVQKNYNDLYVNKNIDYKYLIADVFGDENMTNSANKLGWTAKTLSGGTQKITDYRLVNNADDLQNINFSKGTAKDQFLPMNWDPYAGVTIVDGKIHGNYMLNADIDLSSISKFNPLGYNMTYADFVSESDLVNFNGLNFKISGLNTDSDYVGAGYGPSIKNVGLFSVFSGTIKNLRLENFNVTSSSSESSTGGLIGSIGFKGGEVLDLQSSMGAYLQWSTNDKQLSTTIKNVSLSGTNNITSESNNNSVGGLVGNIGYAVYFSNDLPNATDYIIYSVPGAPKVVFENVEHFNTDEGSVKSSVDAGGIIGSKVTGNLTVKNTINSSNVYGEYGIEEPEHAYYGAGGILGYSHYSDDYRDEEMSLPVFDEKYSSLSFENVVNRGNISGIKFTGGLLGRNNVLHKNIYDLHGNILGEELFLSDSAISIKKSWNEGTIYAKVNDNVIGAFSAGGLVGELKGRLDVDQVLNLGHIIGTAYVGGLLGTFEPIEDSTSTLKNAYNAGNVESKDIYSRIGGLVGVLNDGTISNVYNMGNVTGYFSTHKVDDSDWRYQAENPDKEFTDLNYYAGGLFGKVYSGIVNNSYNLGEVTNAESLGAISGIIEGGTFKNVYNAATGIDKLFGAYGTTLDEETHEVKELTPTTTNVKNIADDSTLDVSDIYKTWSIDKDGMGTNKLWRVYADTDNPNDKTRQPLLTAFLNDAKINRYTELSTEEVEKSGGEVAIADLVTIENSITHTLHNSDGSEFETRYKNSGKNSDDDTTADFTKYDIVESAEDGKFSVSGKKYLAEALMNSSQFGYDFRFQNNKTDWSDVGDDTKLKSALNNPVDNATYLRTPAVKNTVDIEIKVGDGEIKNNVFTALADDDNKYFTVSSDKTDDETNSIVEILGGVLKVVNENDSGKKTTVTVDENKVADFELATADNDNTYTVTTKDNKTYKFIKTDDYTFAYVTNEGTDDEVTYNVTIDQGTITTYKEAAIKVSDGKVKGDQLTLSKVDGKDYSVSGNGATDISNLLNGVLTVEKNSDGTATELKFNSGVTITDTKSNSDGTTTYTVTKGGTVYEFTKNADGTTYIYNDKTNNVNYEVTLEQGKLTYEVSIKVDDMTVTDDVKPTSTSYQVTNDNKVTNSGGVITELINGKLNVVETADGLNTTLEAKDQSALVKDGNNYTYRDANNNIYNFTKSGNVYTYTDPSNNVTYEVSVEQGSLNKIYNIGIQVSDGVFYINENGNGNLSLNTEGGYSMTDNVGNEKFSKDFTVKYNEPLTNPGDTTQVTGPYKTTVTVTNKDGNSYTTNDFNKIVGGYNKLTPNADGTYSITPIKNGNVQYNITIKPGEIVSNTTIPVTINVGNITITDGTPSDDADFTVSNSDIGNLLKDKLQVIQTDDGKTSVKFKDGTNLADGEHTYTFDGKDYIINKDGDTYTYKVTNSKDEVIEYVVNVNPGNITNYTNKVATIKLADGTVKNDEMTLSKVDGKDYSVSGNGATDISNLLNGVLKVQKNDAGTATELKFNSGVTITDTKSNGDGTITYTVTKGGTPYEFTKNVDGSYSYTDNSDPKNILKYNVSIDPGNLTYVVNVKANDATMTDNVLPDSGYKVTSDNGNFITDLISGKISVVESVDGLHTTLQATNRNALKTNSDGSFTYTDSNNKSYNFTQSGNVFSYTDPNNNVKYEVTLEQGDLNKIYNIGIQVSDGVFYIDENGNGSLDLELPDGFSITKNPDNSKFADNFTVQYNDPADTSKITGPATTTVAVINKYSNENYNTTKINSNNTSYSALSPNPDGSYSFSAVKDNFTYNINIKTGVVVSDTKVPVSINVDDIKITDGTPSDAGFSVSNSNIGTLLKDKLQVVQTDDGKTSVKFKDGTTLQDGENIYQGYNIIKNSDGTYTYKVTNPNNEVIQYNVSILPGNISYENNTDVSVKVNDGSKTDGYFSGNGYSVDNPFILNLLNGNLKVVETSDNHTSVNLVNPNNLSTADNGKFRYSAADGKTYEFSKLDNNVYSYSVTTGVTTTNYKVTIENGNIISTNNIPVSIHVSDGKISNGNLSVISENGKPYTVDNDKIATLLTDVLTFDKNSNGTATTLKFKDGTSLHVGDNTYNGYSITKNADGTYTYTDNSDPKNILKYIVSVEPGSLTYLVNVKTNDATMTDNVLTDSGYKVTSDNGNFISDLISGKLSVVESVDGLHTTLQATNRNALKTNSDGSFTYTDSNNKTFNFTQNGNVFTYTDPSNNVKYEVTLEQGSLNKIYNIGIQVSDGVFYIDENGNGSLDLELPDGFSITKNPVNSKFADNFTVQYNDPADISKITGPATTTVAVINKYSNENYNTTKINSNNTSYSALSPNPDGSYTISAVKDNFTYNINIKTGVVVSDTKIPVSINVDDIKITDGTPSDAGFSVSNSNIGTLLKDKLQVVQTDDGKTSVKFKDGTTLNVGDNIYQGYNITKNSDGSYSYKVTNKNDEVIEYKVSILPGNISYENNTDVSVKVNDGSKTDGYFSGNGYSVDNPFILNLLNGNLKVVETSDNHTSVNLVNPNNLSTADNGKFRYSTADGKTYEFSKLDNNVYSYSVTTGVTTTNYRVTILNGDIISTNNIPVSIHVSDGKISNGNLSVISENGKPYTVSNDKIATLLTDILTIDKNSDGTATTLKFKDGTSLHVGDNTYKGYTITKNSDGTYTYTDKTDPTNILKYNVSIAPGSLTYAVNVKVDDTSTVDNVTQSGGSYKVFGDNGNFITDLISGKISVVESADGLNAILVAKDSGALKNDGNGNLTYTDSANNIYHFTKAGNVYTYTDPSNNVTYEVTVEPGELAKTYNIGIQVSDGVFYINEHGDGTLSLELANGYSITKNPDNSKFADNFTVKYNDPADISKITGPASTTVAVINKSTNENYNTKDINSSNGVYNSLLKNPDGSYTISAVKDNVSYNINIKTGLVVSDTQIPVSINVGDGTITDGVFSDSGYSVTNSDISNLLQDKLQVVRTDDGMTSVQFKDGTTLTDGEHDYSFDGKSYNITKNSDGSYTYKVTNPNNEVIQYNVKINQGNITTENNTVVTVKVNDGSIVDGNFSDNSFSVDNSVIQNILRDNLKVVPTNDDKNTTVAVINNENLKEVDGKLVYTASDGKNYEFKKISDNQYLYSVTTGVTTTNYKVNIVNGDIISTNNIPVSINVGDGTITDGVFADSDFTISNPVIENLLKDKLQVVQTDDGKTSVKFKDGTTLQDGENIYQGYTITKDGDSYIYKVTNPDNEIVIYNVTINPGVITNYENKKITIDVEDGTITDGIFTGGKYTISDPTFENLIGKLDVTPTDDNNHTTINLPDRSTIVKNDDGTFTFTNIGIDGTITKYNIVINQGDISKFKNEKVTINVGDGKNDNGTFSNDGYTLNNDTIRNLLDGVIKVTTKDNATTTIDFVDKGENVFTDNGDGTFIYRKDGIDYPFTKTGENNYTFTITDNDGVTNNYTIEINPGNVTNYFDKNVLVQVGDGTIQNEIFTDSGYTVDDDLIGGLLEGELKVDFDGVTRKTTISFANEENLTANGANYRYNKNGTTYSFNKNRDGTFNYVVTSGNNITTYNVTVNPGKLNIIHNNNVVNENPTPAQVDTNPAPTPTTTTPSTPNNSNSTNTTPTNNTTSRTTNSSPAPTTTTTSTPTTISEPTPTTPINSEPEVTTPINDEPTTPIIEEPAQIVQETEIPTNDEPTLTPLTSEPEPVQIVDEPVVEPELTTTEQPAQISENEQPAEKEIPNENLDNTDYELRNSNVEEFPEEKGDYIDLDAQDHILIETTDTNEVIQDLEEAMPEEFNEANTRNIVNNNAELTSISESPTVENSDSNSRSRTDNSAGNERGANTNAPNSNVNNSANNDAENISTDISGGGLELRSINDTTNRESSNQTSENDSDASSSTNSESNLNGDLGNIESGRSDSSQEVNAEQNSENQSSQSQNDDSQNNNASENQDAQTSENDSDDDDDKDEESAA